MGFSNRDPTGESVTFFGRAHLPSCEVWPRGAVVSDANTGYRASTGCLARECYVATGLAWTPSMNELLPAFEEDQVIAWRNGTGLTQGEFLADVLQTADRLPNSGFVLNVCEDRYNFLVAIGAAAACECVSVLPHTAASGAL